MLLGAHVFHAGAALYGLEGHQQGTISTRALPSAGGDGPELLALCKWFYSKMSILPDIMSF